LSKSQIDRGNNQMLVANQQALNELKIQTAIWAVCDNGDKLVVKDDERSVQMYNSDGTGSPLLALNGFGADVIRFAAGKGVMNHTHIGDHILFVIKGRGIVEYNGVEYDLYPGICYLVPGSVNHAIRAIQNLVLIAVGNNHKPLESEERMKPLYNVGGSDEIGMR
jgi:mannose-6-phosphate isomerase-like protein (cupin superfamily)